jgi:hypothetical protein
LFNKKEKNLNPDTLSKLCGNQTYKVRQIASTLLNHPGKPDSTTANEAAAAAATTGPQPISTVEAENYLRTFLDILVRLEGVGPSAATMMSGGGGSGQDSSSISPDMHLRTMSYGGNSSDEEDEEEIRQWASFKEFQRRFVESGGVLFSL